MKLPRNLKYFQPITIRMAQDLEYQHQLEADIDTQGPEPIVQKIGWKSFKIPGSFIYSFYTYITNSISDEND